MPMQLLKLILCSLLCCAGTIAHAGILPEAVDTIHLAMMSQPTSRPMSVAYVPDYKRYYIADGGLGAMRDGNSNGISQSEVHVYSADGKLLQSVRAGLDNRSLYFNPNTHQLESITYNISSDAGMLPGCGIFSLETDSKGNLSGKTGDLFGFNPAFGDFATMPSYDPEGKQYFAKQMRGNKVLIVKPENREKISEIVLDLNAAQVQFDDLWDSYAAYTGIPGEELAVVDVDHKSVLVFDLTGKFIGRSALPVTLKLHAQNHYSGLGYANGMVFVYVEHEGEFGTYHGFRISDKATIH